MNLRYSILFVFLSTLAFGQDVLSPRIANYDIDLELDVEAKMINAEQKIVWKNTSSDTIKELRFHLYYNAFKNSESTFMRDREFPEFLPGEDEGSCPYGWLKVISLKNENGEELTTNQRYLCEDDGNTKDQTVLSIPLNRGILPGESRSFDMLWKSKVPKVMPRTGYNMDFYFFAQWFPKLGVYEPAGMRYAKKGQWNCHQYHARGEYYADFGNYKVSMTVPKDFIVGASGLLTDKKELDNKTKWTFEVNDVIDFAWTCSPHFAIVKDKWNDVELSVFTYKSHIDCTARYLKAIKYSFEYLDKHVGKYPYKSLTILDPPLHGMFTGGMEYPTFITSLHFCFLPACLKTTETLTVHEFIHQYFMQMVATHEQEEAWMDEGITTYYEGRILDYNEGENTSLIDCMGLKIGNGDYNRNEFFDSNVRNLAPCSTKSRDFKHGGYGDIAYNKTAIWLKTLERLVGIETMDDIMQLYFERWKFKHPKGQDFIDVANEIVKIQHEDKFGKNLNWFFDQVLDGTTECDYGIHYIKNAKAKKPRGYVDDFENCEMNFNEGKIKNFYQSEVVVIRYGEMKLPVEVRINFDNGKSILETWDGIERTKGFTFNGVSKVVSVEVDPERKLWIDKNFNNNSQTLEKSEKGLKYYFYKSLDWTQNLMQSMSVFI